jgi:hypothetical protein
MQQAMGWSIRGHQLLSKIHLPGLIGGCLMGGVEHSGKGDVLAHLLLL